MVWLNACFNLPFLSSFYLNNVFVFRHTKNNAKKMNRKYDYKAVLLAVQKNGGSEHDIVANMKC